MSSLEDFARDHERTEQLRSALARTQRQLRAEKDKNDVLVRAATQAAVDAVLADGPVTIPAPKQDKRDIKAEVALMHMTDWQGSKVTTSYNSEVMVRRVHKFLDSVERITNIQRAHHPVRDAVVLLGGDMVEGLFNFPTQPFEIDATIFEQWASVSRLLIDAVNRVLAQFENVTVVAEWGNHGRIGSKRSAVPRSDNFDRMVYEHSRQVVAAGNSRVTWYDCPEDVQRVEVGNYRAILIHGDEVGRNGFASPMTMVQHVTKWQSGALDFDFTDCYVGHYHNHAEFALPNGKGSVYYTGSTESDNRYARDTMGASATPSQRLHFIDPDQGRVSATYKVWVD